MANLLLPIILVLAAASWFAVPHAWRLLRERSLARRCRDLRAIVLSYDDGPGAETTPRLIELLATRGVAAVFFPLGRNAAARPELVRELLAFDATLRKQLGTDAIAYTVEPKVDGVAIGVR